MKHEAVSASISDRLNSKRRAEILAYVDARPYKIERHIIATCDPITGHPDGGTTSAVISVACYRCGLSRDAILDLVDGDKCNAQRARFAVPVLS